MRAQLVGNADVEVGEIGELVELVAERLRDAQGDLTVVAEPERDESGVGLVDAPRHRVAWRRSEVVVGDP